MIRHRCPHCGNDLLLALETPDAAEDRHRRTLIKRAAEEYGVKPATITGRSRVHAVHLARSIVAYLLRQEGMSLPRIGQVLNRDHTTVLYLVRGVEQRIAESDLFALRVQRVAGDRARGRAA